jgi:hypothetical protein
LGALAQHHIDVAPPHAFADVLQMNDLMKAMKCSVTIQLSGVIPSKLLTNEDQIGSKASEGVYLPVKVQDKRLAGTRIFTVIGARGPAAAGLVPGSKRSFMEMAVLADGQFVRDAIRVGGMGHAARTLGVRCCSITDLQWCHDVGARMWEGWQDHRRGQAALIGMS